MGGLFKTPKVQQPEQPRKVRMPVQEDPAIAEAAERTKQAAIMRRGRQSTVLTNQTIAGTGQKLGA